MEVFNSSSGRAKMPKVVPELDDLDINLSHNMIRQFENVDYLHRSKKIDLSYNQIIVINPAIYNMKNLNFIRRLFETITTWRTFIL
jgi:hypothetical protein